MLYALISILGILLTIFFVVGTHESAHFFVAKLLGVKVLRFSIGFGKTLFRWHDKKGTEYVFALIPLGGYVKMLDESEGTVAQNELHLAYNRQPFYKKFLIVAAGPAMNIACALVLYWLIFLIGFTTVKPIIGNVKPHSIASEGGLLTNQEIVSVDGTKTSTWTSVLFRILLHAGNHDDVTIGVKNLANGTTQTHSLELSNWRMDGLTPDPLSSLGITPYEPQIPLIIGIITANSPAAQSPLKIGDKIIAINNQPISNWNDLITFILKKPGETLTFSVERNNKTLKLPVAIGYHQNFLFQKSGYLGIAPNFTWPKSLLNNVKYGPINAIPRAWQQIVDFTYFNFILFGKLLTGKLSLQSLGGPITIFESAGEALNYSFFAFLGFLAFLSISVGIINVLPIPGLDGGHLVIQIIESIIRRPIPDYILIFLYRIGFLILFFILLQALINDILRL